MKRHGQWALVAGASEGLGAAFAAGLAAEGHDLILVARRVEKLERLAETIRRQHGVAVAILGLDLSAPDLPARLAPALEGKEIGILVCNAAYAPLGPFLAGGAAEALRAVDLNCRAPLLLLLAVLPGMKARGRGAVVLMSSLTAFQGSPWTSVYGGTKAFGLALAEGLWAELGAHGIEVIACCAGATRTPNYLARAAVGGAPGELEPAVVVAETLAALGKGPLVIPGRFNRIASQLMRRLLPRAMTVRIMGSQTRRLLTD